MRYVIVVGLLAALSHTSITFADITLTTVQQQAEASYYNYVNNTPVQGYDSDWNYTGAWPNGNVLIWMTNYKAQATINTSLPDVNTVVPTGSTLTITATGTANAHGNGYTSAYSTAPYIITITSPCWYSATGTFNAGHVTGTAGTVTAFLEVFTVSSLWQEQLSASSVYDTMTLDRSGMLNPGTYYFGVNALATSSSISNIGFANFNDVVFTFTEVPEPATLMLLGFGASAFLRRRR